MILVLSLHALKKYRCTPESISTANYSLSQLSRGMSFACDWCHHQKNTPLSSAPFTCRRVPRRGCRITAVDTLVADADLNSTSPDHISSIMYLCIMMNVSCISSVLCALYRALTNLQSKRGPEFALFSSY